jgi:hypothetical protein
MKVNLLICSLVGTFHLCAQKKNSFAWPLDSPHVLTGNYGELRPSHFHAGLDLSTSNKTGQQVYAIAEGYVSRLKVSPYGYGKAIYLTHPNGRVSVYAHLQSFSFKEGELVKKTQYEKNSFEVEIYPKPGQFPVRKGEIIGLSGNSGGSSGPHLHFEVRDEKTETPLNPLLTGDYSISDKIPPVLQQIAVYDLTDTTSPVLQKSYKLNPVGADSFAIDSKYLVFYQAAAGIAFAGFDKQAVTGNSLNIAQVRLFVDDKLVYSHTLDHVDFADNRYVNEFSEQNGTLRLQKCFLPTFYPQGLYGKAQNKGRIMFRDSSFHKIRLVVADEKGNIARAQINLALFSNGILSDYHTKTGIFVNCAQQFHKHVDGVHFDIPARAFYNSANIRAENLLEQSGMLKIFPENINMSSAVQIGFAVPQRWKAFENKLMLKDQSQFYIPKVRHDSVFYNVKNFGTFQIETDMIAPEIKPKAFTRKAEEPSICYTVTDKQSGVGKYELFLNGKWVLAEYDPKNDLIVYFFDEDTPQGHLEFKLTVQDRVGNTSTSQQIINR